LPKGRKSCSLWNCSLLQLVMCRDWNFISPPRSFVIEGTHFNITCKNHGILHFAYISWLCNYHVLTFDLWMSRLRFDTFTLIVNLINEGWVLRHLTIWCFEAVNIIPTTLTKLWNLYKHYKNYDFSKCPTWVPYSFWLWIWLIQLTKMTFLIN
jgi:hypothetical protein